MPFNELALSKLKAGPDIKDPLTALLPSATAALASQPTIISDFVGKLIDDGIVNDTNHNTPILIMVNGRRSIQHISDQHGIRGVIKPLVFAPAELQISKTESGVSTLASGTFKEIIRVQLTKNSDSAIVPRDAWES